MKSLKRNRMWFHQDLLKTEALRKIIDNSRPSVEKEIRHYVREIFLDKPELKVMEMALLDIQKEIFNNNKFEGSYIKTVLQERMNLYPYHV